MALTSSKITEIIDGYISCLEGSKKVYWNAGITPDKNNWGFTSTNCKDTCTSNAFGGGTQCYGFARFIAYLLTGIKIDGRNVSEDENKIGNEWVKITDLTEYEFKPGDIVETSVPEHTAIVREVTGNSVQFLELWSSSAWGCKIAYGNYNGESSYSTLEFLRKTISEGGSVIHVLKCPNIEEGMYVVPPTTPPSGETSTTPEPSKITVTFKLNTSSDGGPVMETREYTVGGKYSPMPVPSRTGYVFDGWWPEHDSKSSEFTEESTVTVTYDHSLYAHWEEEKKTVSVTFKLNTSSNGGPIVGTKTYTVGEAYGSLLTPVPVTGYTFIGWYTAASGGTRVTTSTVAQEGTNVLYAHWNVNNYTVTLYPNYDDKEATSVKVTYGNTYGAALDPLTRCGYDFAGWETEDGTIYESTDDVEAKNITLYAKWEVKEMNVYYNSNGRIIDSDTVTYGETYGTNVPTDEEMATTYAREGYEFKGWYHGKVNSNTEVKMDANHSLYARWEPKKIKVSFDTDYEELSYVHSDFGTVEVTYGEPYGELPTPVSCKHYALGGWYYIDDEGNVSDFITPDTIVTYAKDHTLCATWATHRFLLLDYDDGSSIKVGPTVYFGEKYPELPVLEKEGYDFLGWFFDEQGSKYNQAICNSSVTVIPEHPNTLRPLFREKRIGITLDYQGGTDQNGNTVKSITQKYSYEYSLDSYTLTRDGYIFTGWYYDADCTNPVGASDTVTNVEDHTLYAGWVQAVTVFFDSGEYGSECEPITVGVGLTYGELPTPTSSKHYMFIGWAINDSDGEFINIIRNYSTVSVTEDHTLTARWATVRHMTLDFNGGVNDQSTSYREVYFGENYPEFTPPVREGYDFKGWFFNEEGDYYGVECTPDLIVLPEHPDVIIARWSRKDIKITFDGMGGSPTYDYLTQSYGDYYALPWAIRSGYELIGWYFDKEYTEVCTSNDTIAIPEDHTLYARWELN